MGIRSVCLLAFIASVIAPRPSQAAGFSLAPDMGTPRADHTATVLPTGKVLIAGGSTANQSATATALLYDPTSNAFTPTGSLNVARYMHSATLLPNGKVLIAGGYGNGQALSSAELYDPSTATFTLTAGPMQAAVAQGQTATLLQNGKVLIIGGFFGYGNAQLYDPATDTFSATGATVIGRFWQTATLLQNGKVLVTGGNNFATGRTEASAELYDPNSGTFSLLPAAMSSARALHTANLLPNGQVLIAGGLITGGYYFYLSSAELYDPATGAFTATQSMATARAQHTATSLSDGSVLLASGDTFCGTNGTGCITVTPTAELFDPALKNFTPAGSMNIARDRMTASLLATGAVLISGGTDTQNFLSIAELYNAPPPTGTISVATNSSAATFTITGPTVLTGSGTSATFANVPTGTYTITYGNVPRYITPPSQRLLLASGATASFPQGVYVPITVSVCATAPSGCVQTLQFSYVQGSGQAASQQITISSNAPGITFSATPTTNEPDGNWIAVTPTSGTTAATLSVAVASKLKTGTYSGTISVASSSATNSPQVVRVALKVVQPGATEFAVNGHRLSGWEPTNVLFVGTTVIPQLLGNRGQRITIGSRASWWGLKEGTFSLPNPAAFSSCTKVLPNGSTKDVRLGPLEICETGHAWQVGIAAVQVPNFSESEVADAVTQLWPGRQVTDVLAEAATLAGFSPSSPTGAAIISSSGVLRKSWLLRHPVVGLTLVERNVTVECIEGSAAYCYGSGWTQTKDFAPNKEAALRSISDLATIFDAIAPQ